MTTAQEVSRFTANLIQIVSTLEPMRDARDLYFEGYEPKHQTMRKRFGEFEVIYRENVDRIELEFCCIYRYVEGQK